MRTRRSAAWAYAPIHATMFKALFLRGARTVVCPVTTLGQLLEDLHIR